MCFLLVLAGSHASPLSEMPDLRMYDLMLSVVDNFVDDFRQLGLRSERLPFAFEPRLLSRFGEPERSVPVQWLEHLSQRIPIQVWTGYTKGLPEGSPVRGCIRGTAWGAEM